MHPLQLSSDTVAWAGKNLAYNLKFIADDKLNWKPVESAKSALEICAEVVSTIQGFQSALKGEKPEFNRPSFSTRQEAQSALESVTGEFAQFLLTLSDADLQGDITLPYIGTIPKVRAVLMPVVESVHHHGQVVYIQTLLGDTDSHFYEMGS